MQDLSIREYVIREPNPTLEIEWEGERRDRFVRINTTSNRMASNLKKKTERVKPRHATPQHPIQQPQQQSNTSLYRIASHRIVSYSIHECHRMSGLKSSNFICRINTVAIYT
jgi:hypothetical protein